MLCPNCGNEIGDGDEICPYCDLSKSITRTKTMSDWRRQKSEEKRQRTFSNQEEVDKKIANKLERMEAEQAKIGLDRMIAELESSVKPEEQEEPAESNYENISMGPTARLTEKDLDELIAILTKDKKKQVRKQMGK
jgi:hypothetical protein